MKLRPVEGALRWASAAALLVAKKTSVCTEMSDIYGMGPSPKSYLSLMEKMKIFLSSGLRNNGCFYSMEYCEHILTISVDVQGVLGTIQVPKALLSALPFGRSSGEWGGSKCHVPSGT